MEADILYTAVFSGEKTKTWRPKMLDSLPDITSEFTDGEGDRLADIVKVYDTSGSGCELYHDLKEERLVLRI